MLLKKAGRKPPQISGVIVSFETRSPRKPNSGKRKCVKMTITDPVKKKVRTVVAYIPGEGHNLTAYTVVLAINRGPKDTPGVNYTLIRGARGLKHVESKSTKK